jgi:hypothetical protein
VSSRRRGTHRTIGGRALSIVKLVVKHHYGFGSGAALESVHPGVCLGCQRFRTFVATSQYGVGPMLIEEAKCSEERFSSIDFASNAVIDDNVTLRLL